MGEDRIVEVPSEAARSRAMSAVTLRLKLPKLKSLKSSADMKKPAEYKPDELLLDGWTI